MKRNIGTAKYVYLKKRRRYILRSIFHEYYYWLNYDERLSLSWMIWNNYKTMF